MDYWRAYTGFKAHGSAGDVARYERDILSNDMPIVGDVLAFLDTLPASRIVWACRRRHDALRYGPEVDRIPSGDIAGVLVASDGDGGSLLLLKE